MDWNLIPSQGVGGTSPSDLLMPGGGARMLLQSPAPPLLIDGCIVGGGGLAGLDVLEEVGFELLMVSIGDALEVLTGVVEAVGVEFETGEMELDGLAFVVGGGKVEGVGPGGQGAVGLDGSDAVVGFGEILCDLVVQWGMQKCFLISLEGVAEDLLFVDVIMGHGVLAVGGKREGVVVKVEGFGGVEFYGLGVVIEGFADGAVVGVVVGEVVPGSGVFGVEFSCFFPLLKCGGFFAAVMEEAAVDEPGVDVVGVGLDKFFVGLLDGGKAFADAFLEGGGAGGR